MRRLIKAPCFAGVIFIAQLFIPLPLSFEFGKYGGPWHVSRTERFGENRRDFHLTTPFWEFGHTWGDNHPFCGLYPRGWSPELKSLAFVCDGYGVFVRGTP
jgi:hypothetical protein